MSGSEILMDELNDMCASMEINADFVHKSNPPGAGADVNSEAISNRNAHDLFSKEQQMFADLDEKVDVYHVPDEDSNEEKASEVGETFHVDDQAYTYVGRDLLAPGYKDAVSDYDYSKAAAMEALANALEPNLNTSGVEDDAYGASDFEKYQKPINAGIVHTDEEILDPGRDILGGTETAAADGSAVQSLAAQALRDALVSADEPNPGGGKDFGGAILDDPEDTPSKALESLDEMTRKIAELRAQHQSKKRKRIDSLSPERKPPLHVEVPPPNEATIAERLKKFINESPSGPSAKSNPETKVLKEKSAATRQDPQEVLDKLAEKIQDFKRQRGLAKEKNAKTEVQPTSTPMDKLTHRLEEISEINAAMTTDNNGRQEPKDRKRRRRVSRSRSVVTRRRTHPIPYRRAEYTREAPPTFDKNMVKSHLRKRFKSLKDEVMAEKYGEHTASKHQQHLLETLSSNLKPAGPKPTRVRNPLVPDVGIRVQRFDHLRQQPRMQVYVSNQKKDNETPTGSTLAPKLRQNYYARHFDVPQPQKRSHIVDYLIRR